MSLRIASHRRLSPLHIKVELTNDGANLARSLGVYRFWPDLSRAVDAQLTRDRRA
jgi:hypothetical protein